MASFLNTKGTTYSSFSIGKSGPRIYQGSSDPGAANTGDFWLDTNGQLQTYQSGAWELIHFDNLTLSGNTISSTDTNGNISLTPDGTGEVVLGSGSNGVVKTDSGTLTIDSGSSLDLVAATDITFTPDALSSFIVNSDSVLFEDAADTTTYLSITSSQVSINIDTVFGGVVTLNADPANPLEAATKQYVDNNSGGASTFLDLTDTPSAYTGEASKVVRVNAAADALEFGVVLGDAATKGVTGLDANAVTGTAGTNGNFLQWNTDGDAVDSGNSASSFASSSHTHILADITDSGSMASQDATAVNIDGGSIDGTTIGAAEPLAGSFSSLDVSGTSVVLETRSITAGTGLTGGGDLSANRTINIDSTVLQEGDVIKASSGGSQSTPTITWNDDTDTGFYSNSADVIRITCNGNFTAQITEDKVSINTTATTYTLDVNGTFNVSSSSTFGSTVSVGNLLDLTNSSFRNHIRLNRAEPLDISQGTNDHLYITWEGSASYSSTSRWIFSPTGSITHDSGSIDAGSDITLGSNHLILNDAGSHGHEFGQISGTDGIVLRTLSNGNEIFQVRSSGQAVRFRVDHGVTGLEGTATGGWQIGSAHVLAEGNGFTISTSSPSGGQAGDLWAQV